MLAAQVLPAAEAQLSVISPCASGCGCTYSCSTPDWLSAMPVVALHLLQAGYSRAGAWLSLAMEAATAPTIVAVKNCTTSAHIVCQNGIVMLAILGDIYVFLIDMYFPTANRCNALREDLKEVRSPTRSSNVLQHEQSSTCKCPAAAGFVPRECSGWKQAAERETAGRVRSNSRRAVAAVERLASLRAEHRGLG